MNRLAIKGSGGAWTTGRRSIPGHRSNCDCIALLRSGRPAESPFGFGKRLPQTPRGSCPHEHRECDRWQGKYGHTFPMRVAPDKDAGEECQAYAADEPRRSLQRAEFGGADWRMGYRGLHRVRLRGCLHCSCRFLCLPDIGSLSIGSPDMASQSVSFSLPASCCPSGKR